MHLLELGEVGVDLVDGDRARVVLVQDSEHAGVLLLVDRELHLHLGGVGVHEHALFLLHCGGWLQHRLRVFGLFRLGGQRHCCTLLVAVLDRLQAALRGQVPADQGAFGGGPAANRLRGKALIMLRFHVSPLYSRN